MDPSEERPAPTEDEIDERIRDSGLAEDVIVERTQRMMELQRLLMGSVDAETLQGQLGDAGVNEAEIEDEHEN